MKTETKEKEKFKKQLKMKTRINQILIIALFGFSLLAISVRAEGTEKRNIASGHEAVVETNTDSNSVEMVKAYWEDSISTFFQDDTLDYNDWIISLINNENKRTNFLEGTEKQIKTNLWKYFTESIVLD